MSFAGLQEFTGKERDQETGLDYFGADRTDLVRRGQAREVTVKPGQQDVEFDIELELPRNR